MGSFPTDGDIGDTLARRAAARRHISLDFKLLAEACRQALQRRGPPADQRRPTLTRHHVLSHYAQGNESRLTSQRSQYLQEILRVPRCALAAALDGTFVCDLANQIESEMADDGHVLGAVAGAQA